MPAKMKKTHYGPDDLLTTGQVAQLCQVAPRTVVKWVDGGTLPALRIPGATDRRVYVSNVTRFMVENGYRVPPQLHGAVTHHVLLFGPCPGLLESLHDVRVGLVRYTCYRTDSVFVAGYLAVVGNYTAAVVDGGDGRAWAVREVCDGLASSKAGGRKPFVQLLTEDGGEPHPGAAASFAGGWHGPEVVMAVRGLCEGAPAAERNGKA